ncbi:osteoglycin, paralog b [Clupea harengus]|uniref:Mimecan n=1 Tax=Clupea harengus TaxID=7950 RepID=A0A6P3VH79_CLUHA|nr:osteoglycin, paralog b [Clupea harengus]
MMDLKLLFFSVIFLCTSQLFAREKSAPKPNQRKDVALVTNKEELLFNNRVFMEAKKPKKKVVTATDYDIPDDLDQDSGGAQKRDEELPTCLLCVCLTGSVYCEEVTPDMTTVPALPKETAYLYARYNKITRITNKDFADIATLRRIDLTGNLISDIEDGAFSKLDNLEELTLAQNRLSKLPMLPAKLTAFNAGFNLLKTKGLKATAFKKLTKLAYLYLSNNEIEAIPQLPESLRIVHLQNNNISSMTDETFCKGNNTHYIRYNLEEIRLENNPVDLAKYPQSFICLRSLPFGLY